MGTGGFCAHGDGRVIGIVEDDQATPEEKAITEVNTGIYCFRYSDLNEALPELRADNAQGEYYLTDVVALLQEKGRKIEAVKAGDSWEILGPNDRKALAETERLMRQRILMHWMDEGVTFIDPATTYVDPRVKLGADTTVYPGTHLYGETVVGEGCHLGPYTQITGSRIGNNCRVFFSVLDTVEVGDDVNIGPFANLRPGTVVEARAKVGDFVELKNSRIGMGSKVPHLSYIGDSPDRKRRQYWGWYHHLQLRWQEQARHNNQGRGFHREQYQPGGAGDHRRERLGWGRVNHYQGCSRTGAGDRPGTPGGQGELAEARGRKRLICSLEKIVV